MRSKEYWQKRYALEGDAGKRRDSIRKQYNRELLEVENDLREAIRALEVKQSK